MTSFRSTSSEDYTFFAPSDGVTGNIYTAISVAVTGASDFDTFSDAYDEAVKTVADRIEHQIQTTRQKARRQPVSYTHLDVYKRQPWGVDVSGFRLAVVGALRPAGGVRRPFPCGPVQATRAGSW